MSRGTFYISSYTFFLTYSYCPLEKETILDNLIDMLEEYYVTKYIIAKEFHRNGFAHIHVWLRCKRPIQTRNESGSKSGKRNVLTNLQRYQLCQMKKDNLVLQVDYKLVTDEEIVTSVLNAENEDNESNEDETIIPISCSKAIMNINELLTFINSVPESFSVNNNTIQVLNTLRRDIEKLWIDSQQQTTLDNYFVN
ncbi:5364_t:CDS:2 [Ambispora leptoticha]|uniref:5364_t:CDS:1 n=1 Tax=Ambispora leptoticha TaxID=144679 RepID=A0A9N9FWB0_9GLOM|nr:5364_t:CDS:2 [Ambispora leptoticha]